MIKKITSNHLFLRTVNQRVEYRLFPGLMLVCMLCLIKPAVAQDFLYYTKNIAVDLDGLHR